MKLNNLILQESTSIPDFEEALKIANCKNPTVWAKFLDDTIKQHFNRLKGTVRSVNGTRAQVVLDNGIFSSELNIYFTRNSEETDGEIALTTNIYLDRKYCYVNEEQAEFTNEIGYVGYIEERSPMKLGSNVIDGILSTTAKTMEKLTDWYFELSSKHGHVLIFISDRNVIDPKHHTGNPARYLLPIFEIATMRSLGHVKHTRLKDEELFSSTEFH